MHLTRDYKGNVLVAASLQKDQMALFIRTIGIARAETKVGLANLAYNIERLVFHER